MTIVTEIIRLLDEVGTGAYFGERVTEAEHALQAAHLARQAGAANDLVAAALLHDVGHLLHDLGEDFTEKGIDDRHETGGAAWLARHFGPSVTEPIRMHVDAKRYLCAVEPGYWGALSEGSQQSLEVQGGRFSAAEAKRFIERPFAVDAVALRRWDDGAKVEAWEVPALESYRECLERAALGRMG